MNTYIVQRKLQGIIFTTLIENVNSIGELNDHIISRNMTGVFNVIEIDELDHITRVHRRMVH